LIMIKGAVPGSKGGWVTVKDAVKKPMPDGVPFPAAIKSQRLSQSQILFKETMYET